MTIFLLESVLLSVSDTLAPLSVSIYFSYVGSYIYVFLDDTELCVGVHGHGAGVTDTGRWFWVSFVLLTHFGG